MATWKQEHVIDKIVENHGKISRAMLEVGYTENTAKNPKNLTESQGFQLLLRERGLTKDFIVQALKKDIELKPGNRLGELNLGAKLTGLLEKEEPPFQQNNFIFTRGNNKSLQSPSESAENNR